jgi:hypothetical protein
VDGPVAGCCECGDETSGSCATELVSSSVIPVTIIPPWFSILIYHRWWPQFTVLPHRNNTKCEQLWDERFSWRWGWRRCSSGVLRRVVSRGSKYGDNLFLRNTGTYLRVYTTHKPQKNNTVSVNIVLISVLHSIHVLGCITESGMCILDPGSRYVTTYISVSLPLYYFLPLLITVSSHALVLLQKHSSHEEDEYTFPSRIIPTGRRGQLFLFFSCVLPFLGRLPSVLAVVICSSKFSSSEPQKQEQDSGNIEEICREGKLDFFLVWLKFFSVSCVLPLLLLTGSPNLRKCVRVYFAKKGTQCVHMWVRSSDDLKSPIELTIRGNPRHVADRGIRNHSPEDEIIEIV